MRNNITALNHPTMQRKLRNAIWFAKMEAKQNGHGREYIENRSGDAVMRVDVFADGSLRVWGDQSRNITQMVVDSIEANKYANRR